MCSQWFIRAFLAIWAVSLTAVGACLMVSHWVPLPSPDGNSLASQEVVARAVNGEWTAFHFLYAECPCSRRVLDHVLSRPVRQDVREEVVLVGGDDEELVDRVKSHGFLVDQLAPAQLKARYGIEAAPLLVVVDPRSQIRYAGGYTDRKRAFKIQDSKIVSDLIANKAVESLPVYGCAVSKSLQAIVDPLRIKPTSRD